MSFKDTGVRDMDIFFGDVKTLLNDFKNITQPLEIALDKFFEITDFYQVPGASKS